MDVGLEFWIGFNVFLAAALALDLGVFHRTAHAVRPREALMWSVIWIALSLLFAVGLLFFAGSKPALEFLTGYAVEKSLSVDNLFVIALIFTYFRVPALYQHRVLFWGVVGALLLRGAFIAVGVYAIQRWHWVIYLFGGLLLLTGIRLIMKADDEYDPAESPVVRLAQRMLPITWRYDGQKFWTRENGKLMATPLFLSLLLVESTDVVFAVDSIPAIFAVTTEPFLVYTSNAFAVLGLRSMYFLLADLLPRFVYLKYGLAAILIFVGAKMLLIDVVHVPAAVSLLVIVSLLGIAVVASKYAVKEEDPPLARPSPVAPIDDDGTLPPGADAVDAGEEVVPPARRPGA